MFSSYPTILLRKGSSGPVVQKLQTYLTQLGQPVAADGVFGAATEAAVIAFQRSNKLDADGVVGPATWEAISEALGFSPNVTEQDAASTTTPAPQGPTGPLPGPDPGPTPSLGSGLSTIQKVGLGLFGAALVLGLLAKRRRKPAAALNGLRHRSRRSAQGFGAVPEVHEREAKEHLRHGVARVNTAARYLQRVDEGADPAYMCDSAHAFAQGALKSGARALEHARNGKDSDLVKRAEKLDADADDLAKEVFRVCIYRPHARAQEAAGGKGATGPRSLVARLTRGSR